MNLPRLNGWMLLTVLVWGTNFVAVKIANEHISPPALAIGRAAPMLVALVLLCALQKLPLRYRGSRDALRLNLHGTLSLGIYMVFFLEAIQRLSPAEASILMATAPIWTAFLAAVLKLERFLPQVLAGACVALVGVAMVVYDPASQSQDRPLGILLMLFAAFIWALSVTLSKPLLDDRSPLLILTLSVPGSFFVLIPYGLVAALHTSWATLQWQHWLAYSHIALLAGVVGFFGFYKGVAKIGPVGAILYQFLVPPTALIAGVLLIGQFPTPLKLAGMAVVLCGVGYAQMARQRHLTER